MYEKTLSIYARFDLEFLKAGELLSVFVPQQPHPALSAGMYELNIIHQYLSILCFIHIMKTVCTRFKLSEKQYIVSKQKKKRKKYNM